MDIRLYTKLLNFRSYSYSKTQIFFRDWLRARVSKMPGVSTQIDDYGNLYVTKGTTDIYNCVIAHLDINQDKCNNAKVVVVDDWIIGVNSATGEQVGLGHDDKAGVYFALQALHKYKNIKLFFPLDEEAGLIGTSKCDLSFFSDVGFMVQLDRRGKSDISDYTNGNVVVTDDTKKLLHSTLKKYGYGFCRCMCTDVGDLVYYLDIQGVNISCGYYNEHFDEEKLSISQYNNAQNFAFEVLNKMAGEFHRIEQPRYEAPSYSKSKYFDARNSANARVFTDGWDDILDEDERAAYEMTSDEYYAMKYGDSGMLSNDIDNFVVAYYSNEKVTKLAGFSEYAIEWGVDEIMKTMMYDNAYADTQDILKDLYHLHGVITDLNLITKIDYEDVIRQIQTNIDKVEELPF